MAFYARLQQPYYHRQQETKGQIKQFAWSPVAFIVVARSILIFGVESIVHCEPDLATVEACRDTGSGRVPKPAGT